MNRFLRGFSYRFREFLITPFDYSANGPDGSPDVVSGFRVLLRRRANAE